MKLNAKQQAIVNATPPHLRGQLADVLEHAADIALNGHVPKGDGGNIAAFFNKQDPAIQRVLHTIKEAADTPRLMPFVEKETPAERYAEFGLDPHISTTIGDALDGLEVQQRTIERLGGPDQPDNSPPSLRDSISAAADFHGDN